jgi:hypothetical protein
MTDKEQKPGEIMPETEKLLIDWAGWAGRKKEKRVINWAGKKQPYLVSPRIWTTRSGQGKWEKEVRETPYLTSDRDYVKVVKGPGIIVAYGISLPEEEQRIKTEQELTELLQSGRTYNIFVDWFIGRKFNNWQNKRLRRVLSGDLIGGSVFFDSQGEFYDFMNLRGHEMDDYDFCDPDKTAEKRMEEILAEVDWRTR